MGIWDMDINWFGWTVSLTRDVAHLAEVVCTHSEAETLTERMPRPGDCGLLTHWLQVKSYKITNPEMLFHFNLTFWSECRSQFVLIIRANMKMIECFSGVFNHHTSKKWSHWMNYWSEVWSLIIRLSVLTGDWESEQGQGWGLPSNTACPR